MGCTELWWNALDCTGLYIVGRTDGTDWVDVADIVEMKRLTGLTCPLYMNSIFYFDLS